MKKILSLLLVGIMVVSMVPTAFATTDYSNGTQVSYNAEADNDGDGQPDHAEAYTVTVPAQLAPGASGNVVAQGTWASNRKLTVTADDDVTLTNSINAADQKVLDVTFPGIELAGSNTAAVTDTKVVGVADISAALFGTWSGTFNYNVAMSDVAGGTETPTPEQPTNPDDGDGEEANLITFTIDGTEYQAEEGMTWAEWLDSDFEGTDKFTSATVNKKENSITTVCNTEKTAYLSHVSTPVIPKDINSAIGATQYKLTAPTGGYTFA